MPLVNNSNLRWNAGGHTHGGGAGRTETGIEAVEKQTAIKNKEKGFINAETKAIKNNETRAKTHIFKQYPQDKFNENTDFIQEAMWAQGLYNREKMDWDKKFSRFGILDPYNSKYNTREYLFFTKPDLCLFDPGTNNIVSDLAQNSPFFKDNLIRYKKSAGQLQSSVQISPGPFMPMLSNACTSTLDVPGISAEMIETAANINGTKISYRGTSRKSDEDHDFTLEFEDTKYLDIYMLFKMWDEYEKLKWLGLINFTQDKLSHWHQYTINRILYDQIAIYKIVVAEDGQRIIYMARVVGCVPNSIPRDAFSDMSDTGPQKLSVGFKGHWVRDMDPIIVHHFNKLAKKVKNTHGILPLYNTTNHMMDGRWAMTPYIDIIKTQDRGNMYYLRWLY